MIVSDRPPTTFTPLATDVATGSSPMNLPRALSVAAFPLLAWLPLAACGPNASTSSQPAPPNRAPPPPTGAAACPATHPAVYDVCKGCNPFQEALSNGLAATEFNAQIRAAVESCVQGSLGGSFLGSTAFSASVHGCIQQRTHLDPGGMASLAATLQNAQGSVQRAEVDDWLSCRSAVRSCGRSSCPDPSAVKAPPPACAEFAGRWKRAADQLVLDIRMTQDCEMTVTVPGNGAEHVLRAKADGPRLEGWMRRTLNPSTST